jgi:hypothetical protein
MKSRSDVGLGIIFATGYDAHVTRAPRSADPCKPKSDDSLSWLAGWDEASKQSEMAGKLRARRDSTAADRAAALDGRTTLRPDELGSAAYKASGTAAAKRQ